MGGHFSAGRESFEAPQTDTLIKVSRNKGSKTFSNPIYIDGIRFSFPVLCNVMNKKRRDDQLLRQIADRIREIRKELKITQDVVFEDIGVNVSVIESKAQNLTMTTVAILCDYFEVSLEDFFRGIGNQYPI